jgi:hypothetical protein
MADPEMLRKKGRPATVPIGSTQVPQSGQAGRETTQVDQLLDRQQTEGNSRVNSQMLSRARPSQFTGEEIQEHLQEQTFTEPETQAPSLVAKGELETRDRPGRSVPMPFQGGNFTHQYAEPLRQVLPPPQIDPRFAADVAAGDIIPLAQLPDGLLAEQPIGELFRADRVTIHDASRGIIYEIKPDTVTSIRNGQNQVLRSVELANQSARDGRRDWQGVVVVYNRRAAWRFVAPPGGPVRPGRGPRRGGAGGRGRAARSGTLPAEGESVSTTQSPGPASPTEGSAAGQPPPVSQQGVAAEEAVVPVQPSPLETGHYDVLPSKAAPKAAPPAGKPVPSPTSSTQPPAQGGTSSTGAPAPGETTGTPEPKSFEASTTGPGAVRQEFGAWNLGTAVAPVAQGAGTYLNELGIQAMQNQELQKAADAVARLESEKREALARGKWVITVVVFDYRINLFEHVFREPDDVKRFHQAYLMVGDTYDEARYGTKAEREATQPLLLAGRPSFPPTAAPRSNRFYAHALWDVAAPPERVSGSETASSLFGRWHPANRPESTLQVTPMPDGIKTEFWHTAGEYRVTVNSWTRGAPTLVVTFTDDQAPGWRRTSRFEVVTPDTMMETFELQDPAHPELNQKLGFQLWFNALPRLTPGGRSR